MISTIETFVVKIKARKTRAQARKERVEAHETAVSLVVATVELPDGTDHAFSLYDTGRFMAKTKRTEDGHVLWTGAKCSNGYGMFRLGGEVMYAHRVMYQIANGPIPEGLHLDHLCRIRHCVSSACLEPVTCEENILRGEGASAVNSRKTHCINDHEFTPENTRISLRRSSGRNRRTCLTCEKDRNAVYHAASKV